MFKETGQFLNIFILELTLLKSHFDKSGKTDNEKQS